jgi:hypothetical protein
MADTPEQMRGKLLESLGRPILIAMEKEEITDELLAKKLKEELNANVTKQFQYEGNVVEADPLIAWDVRQRARQDAHKLRGDYPVEKKQISIDGGLPVVPLSEEDQLELEAMKELMRQKLKKP